MTRDDAISRQAALDAMATWDWQELYLPIHFKQLLEDLPSVSTEKTGRWIDLGYEEGWYGQYYKCSECGAKMIGIENYCQNCGCKMGVEE